MKDPITVADALLDKFADKTATGLMSTKFMKRVSDDLMNRKIVEADPQGILSLQAAGEKAMRSLGCNINTLKGIFTSSIHVLRGNDIKFWSAHRTLLDQRPSF